MTTQQPTVSPPSEMVKVQQAISASITSGKPASLNWPQKNKSALISWCYDHFGESVSVLQGSSIREVSCIRICGNSAARHFRDGNKRILRQNSAEHRGYAGFAFDLNVFLV